MEDVIRTDIPSAGAGGMCSLYDVTQAKARLNAPGAAGGTFRPTHPDVPEQPKR